MTEPIHNRTLATEYGMPPLDRETFLRLGRTILLVAAGDGELSEAEMEAFWDLGRRNGGTEDMDPEIEAFDWKTAKLEDTVPQGMTTGWKHVVLYEAIKIASADGDFHEGERARIHQAAHALDVHSSTVEALEALAAAEKALQASRLRLFRQP